MKFIPAIFASLVKAALRKPWKRIRLHHMNRWLQSSGGALAVLAPHRARPPARQLLDRRPFPEARPNLPGRCARSSGASRASSRAASYSYLARLAAAGRAARETPSKEPAPGGRSSSRSHVFCQHALPPIDGVAHPVPKLPDPAPPAPAQKLAESHPRRARRRILAAACTRHAMLDHAASQKRFPAPLSR